MCHNSAFIREVFFCVLFDPKIPPLKKKRFIFQPLGKLNSLEIHHTGKISYRNEARADLKKAFFSLFLLHRS